MSLMLYAYLWTSAQAHRLLRRPRAILQTGQCKYSSSSKLRQPSLVARSRTQSSLRRRLYANDGVARNQRWLRKKPLSSAKHSSITHHPRGRAHRPADWPAVQCCILVLPWLRCAAKGWQACRYALLFPSLISLISQPAGYSVADPTPRPGLGTNQHAWSVKPGCGKRM
ncbi:hypothetical protein BD289DRAFT_148390 [Coniella lustricola]|uniref:Uncharacterized protein n=1 Tax=Coniella lustricola TaxID=2025994 RepID=A0A2T2ZUV6_9PEZI|nr:hypothetical protein BD289DRAFT_148390 [Coniella lustricola]